MPFLDKHYQVSYSRDYKRSLVRATVKTEGWGQFLNLIRKPTVTNEKRREFDSWSKQQQDDVKMLPGWICGAVLRDGKRRKSNAEKRNLMTIDIDYAYPEILDEIRDGKLGISEFCFAAHSTRRHTTDVPRIRFIIPLNDMVTTDEYTALVRYVSWLLDRNMKLVDPVSFRPVQVMYLPSCSIDMEKEYFFFENPGQILDVDQMLDDIDYDFGDWKNQALLPRAQAEEEYRKHAEKAEDPRDKTGIVGQFARAHPSMTEFIANYMSDVYIPTDDDSSEPRFTFAGSTSSNGAVVYDDLFLFSHHGSDPVCDQNVNVFDLFRIHKFGDEDKKEKYERITDAPSYKAMVDFARNDPATRKLITEEKFGESVRVGDAFDEIEEEEDDDQTETDHKTTANDRPARNTKSDKPRDGRPSGSEERNNEPSSRAERIASVLGFETGPQPTEIASAGEKTDRKRRTVRRNPDWFDEIDLSKNNEIKNTVTNVKLIVGNDSRFFGKIAFNELTQMPVLVSDIDPRIGGFSKVPCQDKLNGDPWRPQFSAVIRCILEAENGAGKHGYGMNVAGIDLQEAFDLVSRDHHFNPFTDRVQDLVWDGRPRVDTLFVDYLGEKDTPYARETARNMILASLDRAFSPGGKFDFIPIIIGKQGVRKSTFVKELYYGTFHGDYHDDLGNRQRFVEATQGKVAIELGEIEAMRKTVATQIKTMLRTQDDSVRKAYRRDPDYLPRRIVLWGTTNETRILKDDTGNRSFWLLFAPETQIDTDRLSRERDQIWAEGYEIYQEMRAERPFGDLPLYLHSEEARAEQESRAETGRIRMVAEEIAEEILDWLDAPQLLEEVASWYDIPKFDKSFDENPKQVWVRRCAFTKRDLLRFVTERAATPLVQSSQEILSKALDLIKKAGWTHLEKPRYKFARLTTLSQRWFIRDGSENYGFEIVAPPADDDEYDEPSRFSGAI